jgi:hypothetical protein
MTQRHSVSHIRAAVLNRSRFARRTKWQCSLGFAICFAFGALVFNPSRMARSEEVGTGGRRLSLFDGGVKEGRTAVDDTGTVKIFVARHFCKPSLDGLSAKEPVAVYDLVSSGEHRVYCTVGEEKKFVATIKVTAGRTLSVYVGISKKGDVTVHRTVLD